ncbi:bifunctional DNA primase/polymerase [Nocardia farcinica]|uniref:bifunctional DNA primase/polymerase n=1 Tax=Nocardia farcinica TaxID=37329 RepID=UPI000E00B82D|nr:bifunctional DNA primase/polymerase [Nocardia farcinica]MBA4857095.1 bifunctional DNA primase/polymerase [Nocardia farcinica]MBC9817172.1 bifunctional DNA primase/polymerase [Nocardia farcinica]MBF6262712.1 bifunctional DNA primase/polymerase [Nocardia farcinica]MBF6281216.1 bifunctional DNA primase/polymerase [Nocardia farcinica]MBF6305988.1 bifunctional DNA primase/polymerase [Nocardia farcinica]
MRNEIDPTAADHGRADALAGWLAAAPAADSAAAVLDAWLRDGCALGLHMLLVEPGGKAPVDMRSPSERREADGAAKDAARAQGRANWDRAKSKGGVYLATADPDRLAEFLTRYRERYGAGTAVNVAVALEPSRLVVVDCDTAGQVRSLRQLLGLAEDAAPTVSTPGQRDESGQWVHRDGGHFWFTVDGDDDDVPPSRALGRVGDLKGAGGYVLIPPSVRAEGAYSAAGAVRRYAEPLRTAVAAAGPEPRPGRAESPDAPLALSIDQWAARVPWAALLTRHGWRNAGRADSCGCATWTAPGDHASSKSATAHDADCSHWESDSDPHNRPLHIWTDNPGPELEAWTARTDVRTVSKLQFVAVLEHGADVGAATRALGIEADRSGSLGFAGTGGLAFGDPTPTTDALSLPLEFWERRGFLRHIRDAAWSRDESPHGVLLAVLALLGAYVDPAVRVDTGIKSPLPLTFYAGLVSTSGVGKSSAVSAAERLLSVQLPSPEVAGFVAATEVPRALGLGTGQGIAEAYMGSVRELDAATGKQVSVRKQVRHKVVLHADEAGEMLAMMEQRQSTLAAVLRSAWSGHLRGHANATAESRREITEFSLGLIVGFQREVLARLLTTAELENGTPQRFLFGPVADPYAPDIDAVPDDPGPLVVDLTAVESVRLSADLARRVRLDSLARRRGAVDVPQLESQRPAMLARTAALLAILDGGRSTVEAEDWELAEMLFTVSLAVQRDAEDWARETEAEQAEQRAKTARAFAVATAAAVDSKDTALDRLGRRILDMLQPGEPVLWTGRTGLRSNKFKGADRPLADAALERMVESGAVTFDGDKVARA